MRIIEMCAYILIIIAAAIEASFATQYGLRLRHVQDMSWSEFATLLSGIAPETPLGRVVAIRLEKDRKALQRMTMHEKRIRAAWAAFKAEQTRLQPMNKADWNEEMRKLQASLQSAFGVKVVKT